MNKKQLFYLILPVLLAAGACNNASDELEEEKRLVYNLPPIDAITDSIKNDPDNAELYLERALRLSQNNHHRLANLDYLKAYELTGKESVAMSYISSLLLSQDYQKAINFLEDCIENHPGFAEFRRRLGEVYIQTQQYDLALEQYEELVKMDDQDFESWLEIGMLKARIGDTAAAIQAMETSYGQLPLDYSGLALANLLVAQNDRRALDICDAILSKDSSEFQTDAFYLKGVYYKTNQKPEAAIIQFDSCIKRDWKFVDAYLEKGIIYYSQKKFETALDIFTLAATVSNTVADTYFWMARCYEALGRIDEAEENYQRALLLDKDFYEADSLLRNLRRNKG